MKELILVEGKRFARVEILEGILIYGLEKGLQFWLSILTLERKILKPWVFPRLWNVLLQQVLPYWKKKDLLMTGKRVPALGAKQWMQWLHGCRNTEISFHGAVKYRHRKEKMVAFILYVATFVLYVDTALGVILTSVFTKQSPPEESTAWPR